MTPELAKLLMAIDRMPVERLRVVAADLAKTVHMATRARREENGYRVVQFDGFEMADGARDYCVGYADALNEHTTCGTYRVFCGPFEVHPDWGSSVPSSGEGER